WNRSFAGRGIYMVQSLQGGREQEKGVGASRLTTQACSFYVGVSATVGMRHRVSRRAVRRHRR
ncbi:hypothetical protein ACTVOX_25435, partial [Serratia marcescens]|uniref:hypothetical protein n=1 Tax=Serratia marcescens TaxID=615 RepID=UPI003FA72676